MSIRKMADYINEVHISYIAKSLNIGIYKVKNYTLNKVTVLLRLATLVKLSLAHGLCNKKI